MISLLLEKKRKQAQKTVLGIEYDSASLAAVKLNKKEDSYSLVSCDSDTFPPEAYFEGLLTSDYIGSVVADVVTSNKLSRFTKLGFASYNDVDVSKEEISCDKKALEVIKKEGTFFYVNEYFLKKRYPDNYTEIAYDYYDEVEEKGIITIYYVSNFDKVNQIRAIASKTKKALSVCVLDKLALSCFVKELFLSEISKHSNDSIFLGLYSDKLSIHSFSTTGELKSYESVKIFDINMSESSYVDEAIQLLLRFMDFMSLDFSSDFDNFDEIQDNQVFIYGLKQNFETIFESIKDLSQKECSILDPFININLEAYQDKPEQPYRYVMPISIAMKEAL